MVRHDDRTVVPWEHLIRRALGCLLYVYEILFMRALCGTGARNFYLMELKLLF